MNTHTPLLNGGEKGSKILSVNFNQDQGCFAVGHENGFLVYNTNPIDLRVKRNFSNSNRHHLHSTSSSSAATSSSSVSSNGQGSGIGHVTMLHRTNYLALVGGGKNPKFANNKVIIWDDLKRKNSLNLEFMSPVLNVFLSRIRIIVVLKNQVLVYGFLAPPKKFATYETIDNEYGLADLSSNTSLNSKEPIHKDHTKYQTLAFPGRSIGQIQLVDVSPAGQEKNLVSIIKAHKSKIRCLALNRSGTLIASASETGTIIRIHSTYNTALLYEFRRGLDRAVITSMKFSHNDTKLAVLSDKNTLHVYNVSPINDSSNKDSDSIINNSHSNDKKTPTNRHHLLNKLSIPIPIPNYFMSTWSFCSVNTSKYHTNKIDDGNNNEHLNDVGTIGWAGNDSIIIIWKNKRIWEKYVIVDKQSSNNTHHEASNSNGNWEIIRYSWKSLDSLNE
ncbi:WD40 repeat-like protein [Hyphopichia burtonii NRRL Y-1933]|uniref:WD40 repeat-like protein n=1 Tax=Hyphopichia burtonii NRRL Y-1933 TaxID=984485 RepID=A0A1E4RC49_9ASCO|nr:WD40 repeat-like protein [Hyphopichia burtonii NRRL Y-1933]ODV64827.1 WD40 repeat-like protein [Hyphopichia burtonii NRRL Y-1933]